MKKIFLTIAVIILIYSFSSAQTTIIPGGNVSGIWTFANSPYIIQGSIMIPYDSTLTIEPGVTVDFQGNYKLLVLGRLLAIGTANDTITFIAADTSSGWCGIDFDSTSVTNDSSKFFYCKLQYGKATGASPDDNGGAFYFNNFSKVIISNCRISNNSANSSGGGICCWDNSNPTITNNTITNNMVNNYYDGYGGGIYCYHSSPTILNNTISNNTANGNGGGIYCDNHSNPTISNNTISNNTADSWGGGISCFSSSSPTISNNIIKATSNHNKSC